MGPPRRRRQRRRRPVLQSPVPQSNSPSFVLPYEVFLIIVEYLIAGIEARQHGEIAWAYYQHDAPCKLAVGDLGPCGPFEAMMKHRHQVLRLPSQINQKIRKMVYQTFRPVPMCRRLGSAPFGQILLLPVCALMLPEIDAFISYFAGDQPDAYLRTGNFHLTIHPVMLDLIQIIYLPAIHSLNDMALETLLALPNLKTIMTHIGQKETNISHGGRRPLTLDYNLSSDLGYWHMKYTGRNFDSIWSRFQEKGIKLYGMIGFWERDPSKCIMEIFPSEDGTMIQYVNPNCSCCPRPLTSERRKLRSEMMEELMEELGYWSL